jgi:hypothetical protein
MAYLYNLSAKNLNNMAKTTKPKKNNPDFDMDIKPKAKKPPLEKKTIVKDENDRSLQAWERGEGIPCGKDESNS